jgi:monovalent cation:H+ antiporter-2, CPA2 family
MPHEVSLISTLAAAFGLALVCGFVAARLKLPPLVGYLVAGILIGPATPGFVADTRISAQLAEVGVMLLMFGVGLHFSLEDLLSVRKIAIPGAIAQIIAATMMGAALALGWGWNMNAALVFGLCLSVASTVVLLKALESVDMVESVNGRIAVGWLIVEDLAMVLVLVILPAFEGAAGAATHQGGLVRTLGYTGIRVGAFIAIMLVLGRRILPWLLWKVTRTGSRELFTLCVVAAAITIAFGSAKLFGVSFALGAFFAGMVLRESEFSHRAAKDTLPLRDAFSVLFFVSVGMLFDPRIVVENPLGVLAVLAIIMIGKSLVAMAVVLLFHYPLSTALTISASLAQVGEFSFILATLGVSLKILPETAQSLVVAGSLISIGLNPLLFSLIEPARQWIRGRSEFARKLDLRDDPLAALPATTEQKYLARQVVLVGYGRVGRRIAKALVDRNIPFVVAEQNRERVEQLRTKNIPAVFGDATEPMVLVQAHVEKAHMLIVATPDTVGVREIISAARRLNPSIRAVVRLHNEAEARLFEREQLATVFLGERELARAMVEHVLAEAGRARSD